MNRGGGMDGNWECECDGVRGKKMRCDAMRCGGMTGCRAAAAEPLTCICILTHSRSEKEMGRVGFHALY